jgi:hypothetical protein
MLTAKEARELTGKDNNKELSKEAQSLLSGILFAVEINAKSGCSESINRLPLPTYRATVVMEVVAELRDLGYTVKVPVEYHFKDSAFMLTVSW